ncbi:13852_t:CDS:2, partial [Entrophospora sp. SA101]
FDIAFDSICNLQDVGVIKVNKEKPLTSEKIKQNLDKLRGKLMNGTSKLHRELVTALNGLSISELTWRDPLASRVISDDLQLKPVEDMVPPIIPSAIREECSKFVSNFMIRSTLSLHQGLSHDGNWKENNDKLKEVALKILDTMRNVWDNPAFRPEFVESLNEGTYVNNVVVTTIHASLFDNPFGECAFITTYSNDPSILEEFINTLLILRNILIVNMTLLRTTRPRRSSRNLEDSSTISSDIE